MESPMSFEDWEREVRATSTSSSQSTSTSNSQSTSASASSPDPAVSSSAPDGESESAEERDVSHGELKKGERRVITSELLDPIRITFDEEPELIRAHIKLLPPRFWRTFYETSATLSRYVTVDTHVKHRKRKNLKIKDGAAFQAVAEFDLAKYLTKESIELHLVWNQRRNPSAYISAFNALDHGKRRARFHYHKSQRIGQRVSIASLSTDGLIPATVHARCKSKISVYTKVFLHGESVQFRFEERDVDIPVWIRKSAKEKFGSTITPKQLKESGADMWLSITEIRKSNLKDGPNREIRRDVVCAKAHDYEWLACGIIPESEIRGVYPWDGKRLYTKDPGHPIRSFENSGQPWVWQWIKKNIGMWIPDRFSGPSAPLQPQKAGSKRRSADDSESQAESSEDSDHSTPQPLLSMSVITPVFHFR